MRTITLLALFVCMFIATSATMANDENLPDTLMIDKIQAEKGAAVALKVSFFNDQELAALTIPFGLVGDLYKIDSVSFIGSRVEYLKMRPVTISEDLKEVVFGAICMTEDYIPAGKGLLATLYLSAMEKAKSDFCVIDTVTIGPASVLFTKKNSDSYIPEFQSGLISIGQAAQEEAGIKKSDGAEAAENKGN